MSEPAYTKEQCLTCIAAFTQDLAGARRDLAEAGARVKFCESRIAHWKQLAAEAKEGK